MKNKLGIGVTTKDRPEYFEQCIKTLPIVDFVCYVNDGDEYASGVYEKGNNDKYEVIQHEKNMGIACAKNSALRCLIQNDCNFLFLLEDDILIKNPEVFLKYIKTAEVSGLWHMNYGFSNIYNFNEDGTRAIRSTLDYEDDLSVIFTPNLMAGFQFFHKSVIKAIGYMDERYSKLKNMEHVDHSYKAVKCGLLPSYCWWPDINNSWDYISVIEESIENSQSKDENFKKNFGLACALFNHKYGFNPTQPTENELLSNDQVLKRLENIQKSYARKFLP
jgi:GT2 family glycosyltransferase